MPYLRAAAWLALLTAMPCPAARGVGAREQIRFVDRATESGLDFRHQNGRSGELHPAEPLGSGAALIDYDGDGDLDIYMVQGGPLANRESVEDAALPSDRLFRNDGSSSAGPLRFVDVTAASGIEAKGYGMGVAVADYDDDGLVDLYVTNLGPNQLWRNAGDGTFDEVAESAGAADPGWSTSASWGDIDRDGWLDLWVLNYVELSAGEGPACFDQSSARTYCGPELFEAQSDTLLRNRGDGTFENLSSQVGLSALRAPGLGVVSADFDHDGWMDFFVANDGDENHFWHNRGGGRFEEIALITGSAVNFRGRAEAGMGVDAGDVDGDGDEDLILVHLTGETNTLYLNDGRANFVDGTISSGLSELSVPFTSFGVGWRDLDSDGDLDLFIANGAIRHLQERIAAGSPFPLEQRNQLFANDGSGNFVEVTADAGEALEDLAVSRGAAFGDLDNDGDTDILVTNNEGYPQLLTNEVPTTQWLGLSLLRPSGASALGVGIRAWSPKDAVQARRVRTDGSYASAGDSRVLLGGLEGSSAAEISWMGTTSRYVYLPPEKYLVIRQSLTAGLRGPRRRVFSVPAGKGHSLFRGSPQPVGSQVSPMVEPAVRGAALEPAVRRQLDTAIERARDLEGSKAATSEERATAFGALGQIYHAYELLDDARVAYKRALVDVPRSPRWWYYLGRANLAAGDVSEAVEALDRAVELAPDQPTFRLARGEASLLRGRLDVAREDLGSILEQAGVAAAGHALLGQLALEAGQTQAAVWHLTTALALQPGATELYYPLSRAYHLLGRSDLAVRAGALRGEGRVAVDDPLLLELKRINESAALQTQFGVDAMERGDLKEARSVFSRALELQPAYVPARLNLAAALALAGDSEDAEREYALVLETDEDNVTALFNLGVLAAERGDEGVAIGFYQRALSVRPEDVDARFNLANAYLRSGACAAALSAYERVLELRPGHPKAALGRASCFQSLGLERDALAALEGAFSAGASAGPDVELADALARLLATSPDPGLRDGERALALARQTVAVLRSTKHLTTLAMALAEVGEYDRARSELAGVREVLIRMQDDQELARVERLIAGFTARQPVHRRAPVQAAD